MKIQTLTLLLLLAGMPLLGCVACSNQATPAALSEPTKGVATASASPTSKEIILVTVVEPVSHVIRNDTYYFDNCSGTKERRQSLDMVAQVQKSLTLGSEGTATNGRKTPISEERRAKLTIEIEKAYQDRLAALQTEVKQQEMIAGAYSRFNYTIIWEEWQFVSTVSFTHDGQSYTVPYTYTLLVPRLGSAKSVPCSG